MWRQLRRLWQKWILRRGHDLAPIVVTFYTRTNCPLCDKALVFLAAEQRKYGFGIQSLDVDSNDQLRERFGECVPVVQVEGRVRFRGHISRFHWERLIMALRRDAKHLYGG